MITSSIAGRITIPGSLYGATKWATTAIGHNLRAELRQLQNNDAIKVTLIEPGMVDTPFFDTPPTIEALQPEDVARAVMYAVSQPPHVDVNEILVRPTAQDG